MELGKGQKIPLNENFLTIKFLRPTTALEIDTAAFLTQANGKVAGDEDFVFYGNARHNSGAVTHNDDDSIEIDLSRVPRHVEKISLTATIYDADKRRQNFSMIRGAALKIFGASGEIATFPLENFTVETAIVLGEVYRYKGAWKFNATGAGFSGGLAALCKDFGIEVNDIQPPSPPPPPEPDRPKINTRRERSRTQREEPTPEPRGGGINMGRGRNVDTRREEPPQPKKVELRKGQKVSLIKRGSTLGEIVINLNWSQPAKKTGFFSRFTSRGIDLDLACLFELKDGTIGGVQALGNNFGDLNRPPYIALDGDDRTGAVAEGETIRVNGKYADRIRRILIFTFIYEGAANWEEAKGVVTVNCPGSPELIVRMDEYGSNKRTCAIALLENVGGTFSVEKVVEFFDDSEKMDRAFDWGLRWTYGRKD
ncbi:MAG: TerD domain-containing protein [Selenomonadaceae bacterium]|nr:TerD domain-containing protein [Selenomonadaceae bacterium]